MQETYSFYKNTSTALWAQIRNFPIGNQLLKKEDIASIKYTIYEMSSPLDNEGIAEGNYTDVQLDKELVIFDELQHTERTDKYGTKTVDYNFLLVLAPTSFIGGENLMSYPFPVIGKWYKIIVSIEIDKTVNPNFSDYTIEWIGDAV
jgi:hypothetical protein